jgi:hypothetical protein
MKIARKTNRADSNGLRVESIVARRDEIQIAPGAFDD